MDIVFWVIIILVSAAAEFHTNALAALFVGVGAGVAFVLALGGVPFVIQALAWVVVTLVSIATLRPIALKRFHPPAGNLSEPIHTPMSGQFGIVEDEVGDEVHPGRVKIRGESWRAVVDGDGTISPTTPVVVVKAYGTTLWVRPRADATT